MNKPVYIAAYHQSEFGKLMSMSVPDIITNAIAGACGAIKAGQEVGCVRDEGQGELDVDTPGKPLACQKDRAGDLIRSIGTGTLAGRVPDVRRQQQNNAQHFREGTFADTAQVRSVGSGSHARTGKASA